MAKEKTLNNAIKTEPKISFSYIRLSCLLQTAQAKTGADRQAIAPMVSQEHGWTFNENLSIADLGVSAFKSTNASEDGGLGTLLNALKSGKFPKGRIMIVEAFDRLSRMAISKARRLFEDLLTNGLEIYIHEDRKLYTEESLDNVMDLIMSLLKMQAAHDYSARLSNRITRSYELKKLRLTEEKKPYRYRCFGWLKWDDAKKEYVTLDGWKKWDDQTKRLTYLNKHDPAHDKVAAVKRLFDLADQGYGVRSITKILNQEKVPSIGTVHGKKIKSTAWVNVSVQRIIRGKDVLGLNSHVDPPVKMFPQIIDEKLYYSANTKMDVRKTGKFYGRTNTAKNLFMGLCKCSKCGRSLVLHCSDSAKTLKRHRKGYGKSSGVASRGFRMRTYLQCSGFKSGICSSRQIRYDHVEASFSQSLFCPDFAATFNKTAHNNQGDNLVVLQRQVKEVQKKLETVTADYDANPSSPRVLSVLVKLEGAEKALLEEIEREKARQIGTAPIHNAYSEFLKSLHKDWNNVELRLKVRELIRSMVDRLEVDIPTKSYKIFFKNIAKPIHVETFKNGCRIDGKEYILTSTLDARTPTATPAADCAANSAPADSAPAVTIKNRRGVQSVQPF